MVVRFSDNVSYKEDDSNDGSNGDNVQWHGFLSLESPHPYGVLPAGNRFLLSDTNQAASDNNNNNNNNNNSFLSQVLRDETWLSILGFLDGVSLGNLVQSCRYFYVIGHQPEIWRDLVLRTLDREKSVLDAAGNSWKDTYVMLHTTKSLLPPSKPMKIPGIYSDDLYRLHSCRSFAIPPAWLRQPKCFNNNNNISPKSKNAVPRIKAGDMTPDIFVQNYENPNLPVVICEGAKDWKAFRDWQDPAYLREHTKGRTFRATSGMAPLPANFTLEAFQTYCSNPNLEEGPLYLFDREALKSNSPLHQDFYADMQNACPYFDPNRTVMEDNDKVGHDLFQVLGEGKRPDHTWAIIGGNHSGSVFHIDPNCTHAWNASICGRKRWIFYPPGVTPPGVHPSADGDSVALPLSVGEWILSFWREHQHRKSTAPPSERPLECTAFPGDVVFVPHGWWHFVLNLDRVNVAITHNYVSRSNLGNVLRFLKRKEEQISGCRDRAESIKPSNLHSAFTSALRDQFGENTEWLVQAQQQAASHWTCNAWKDDADVEDQASEDDRGQRRLPKKRRIGTAQGSQEKSEPGSSVMLKAKASSSTDSETATFSFSFM